MVRFLLLAALLFSMPRGRLAVAGPEDQNAEALQAAYEKESNPRKRSELAMELMIVRLERLRARIAIGTMLEQSSPELAKYHAACEQLASSVRQAAHNGTSKKAEKHLRDQIYDLDQLKMSVSAVERSQVDRLIARVVELREEVLYSLMHPPKEQEKR